MLPVLIFLAAGGGYLLAKRSLRPIRKISQTAQSVAESGDLSRRIEVKNRDELGRLSETFNIMFERLEENFNAEKQFTSDASHELRTPVAVILAQCEYALENASGEEELYECIGSIQRQGYRMSKLIESLLAFTRLEQRIQDVQLYPTDISALVESVCDEQAEVPENNISLSREIEPGITLMADATLFSRMISNLIRNSYRYGRENGYIQVSLRQKEKSVLFSVTDNGIGIPAEDLPHIWNRFYRADKSRSREKGGLGLGLSMVRQIARIHKAARCTWRVWSMWEAGLRFLFRSVEEEKLKINGYSNFILIIGRYNTIIENKKKKINRNRKEDQYEEKSINCTGSTGNRFYHSMRRQRKVPHRPHRMITVRRR